MKVIFLGIDGVMNDLPRFNWAKVPLTVDDPLYPYETEKINPECIKLLNRITDATGAKIVISSSWRVLYGNVIAQVLWNRGVTGNIIGNIPVLGGMRGYEIQEWLDGHLAVESFVILDDESDMVHLKYRLIQTDSHEGMQSRHVDMVIHSLNGQTRFLNG